MTNINFKKAKDRLLNGANKGLEQIMNSETAKNAGKLFADYSSGLKGNVANQGGKLVKKYVKDSVTKDNPTGATVGALSESLIKQTATSIKHCIDTLQGYLKATTTEARRYNELPEFEAAKSVFMKYASDSSMQGNETIDYKGVEFIVERSARKLSLSFEDSQKKVQISSAIFKNPNYSELEFELEEITEDLLDNVKRLADPFTVDVNMSTSLDFEKDDGNITYAVNYTKSNGEGNITYTPPKRAGIKLTYTILASKEMENN